MVGPGKLTIHTSIYGGGGGGAGSFTVQNFVTHDTYTGTIGTDLTISIPDISACLNIFDISSSINAGAYGVTWGVP